MFSVLAQETSGQPVRAGSWMILEASEASGAGLDFSCTIEQWNMTRTQNSHGYKCPILSEVISSGFRTVCFLCPSENLKFLGGAGNVLCLLYNYPENKDP